MKTFLSIVVLLTIFSWGLPVQASNQVDLLVKIHLIEGGELAEADELIKTGWKKDSDNNYEFFQTFKLKKLPWSFNAGHTTLQIDSTGTVSGSSSFGDADVGCSGKTRLFKKGERFVPSVRGEPYLLKFSGFESASGAFTSIVKIEIWVK